MLPSSLAAMVHTIVRRLPRPSEARSLTLSWAMCAQAAKARGFGVTSIGTILDEV